MPLILLCLFFFFVFGERWLSVIQVCREIRLQESALLAEETEREELREEREKLKDPAYLTILAREKLCYIFPGEKLYLNAGINDDVLPSSGDEILIED
ncbi:MAG: septum formation initiator family protein [Clostridia bacterium]